MARPQAQDCTDKECAAKESPAAGAHRLCAARGPFASVYSCGFEINLIVTPLTPGQQVIEMKGKGSYGVETDVIYSPTVQPGKQ